MAKTMKTDSLLTKSMDAEIGNVVVDGKVFTVRRVGLYAALGGQGVQFICSGFRCRGWCVHKELLRIAGKKLELEVHLSDTGKKFYQQQAKDAAALLGSRNQGAKVKAQAPIIRRRRSA